MGLRPTNSDEKHAGGEWRANMAGLRGVFFRGADERGNWTGYFATGPKRCSQVRSKVTGARCQATPDRHNGTMASAPPAATEGPSASRRSAWGRWLFRDGATERHEVYRHGTHPWYLVIWLTGVDYFSTLGYQPGIALLAAGAISPIATAVLVGVTLLCALPVYGQVAGRSYAGLGSIAMLEHLLPGWWSKLMVLVLLGFASTDFVITMTLSASDAALHATQNPYLHPFLGRREPASDSGSPGPAGGCVSQGFQGSDRAGYGCLRSLPAAERRGARAGTFRSGLPSHRVAHWRDALKSQGDWGHITLAAAILFPRLALGLSGFETGVSVMPLIAGSPDDGTADRPLGRIRNTRKLLVTAALIMSVLLLVSSFVTVLLIPREAYREGGPASGRAIAYMAHEYLGNVFGSVYDVSTILVLWFAGASAMAGCCIWCRGICRALDSRRSGWRIRVRWCCCFSASM